MLKSTKNEDTLLIRELGLQLKWKQWEVRASWKCVCFVLFYAPWYNKPGQGWVSGPIWTNIQPRNWVTSPFLKNISIMVLLFKGYIIARGKAGARYKQLTSSNFFMNLSTFIYAQL